MKIASGKRAQGQKKDDVEKAAKQAYIGWKSRDWQHSNAESAYAEVNRLKHGADGLQTRNVQYADALKAVDELLSLLEAWRDAGCPQ
jgi:hypothetical protein